MNRTDVLKSLRHDLGKYVAMQCRWAEDDDLIDAVTADVLHTHRSGDVSKPATALWERLLPDLRAVDADAPELRELTSLMTTLAAFSSDDATLDNARITRDAAVAIADLTRTWYRRANAESTHG
jgi:hypothetical protein